MSKAAVVQMVSGDVPGENLASIEAQLSTAREQGAELVLLPENCALMSAREGAKCEISEAYGDGSLQMALSQMAKRFGLWLIAGTLPIASASRERVRAASIVFDKQGATVARYDKIHLFDVRVSAEEAHRESDCVEPGDELVVVDTPIGRVGLSVCYDLRFPELYRQLSDKGAEIFSVPAAFTYTTGLVHWEMLLKARAVENLSYVLAANQGGTHPGGRETYGHSMIIEPWGEIMAECEPGPAVISAEVDLTRLYQLRKQFPCTEHKRL